MKYHTNGLFADKFFKMKKKTYISQEQEKMRKKDKKENIFQVFVNLQKLPN